MKRHLLIAASALALLAAPAMAQTSGTPGQTASDAESTPAADPADLDAQRFVELAASSNTLEIASSESALDLAQDADVKAFAQHMIEDHTDATAKLVKLAETEGVPYSGATTPVAMDPEHVKMLDQLKAGESGKFDAQYMDMQIAAHEQAIALFEAYSQNGDNEALKAFAAETLPVLQEHLQQARALDQTA